MTNSGFTLPGTLANLARVNIRYILEWHRNARLYKAISLPLPPNALSVSSPSPRQITYTLGDEPIRELGEFKRRTIELSGSAGYDARPAYRSDGSISALFGPAILIEFRDFIEEYQTLAAVEGSMRVVNHQIDEQHTLIFRALDEGYHLRVEVSEFSIQRNADESNLTPSWTLNLEAYLEARPPFNPLFNLAGSLATVTQAIQTAADATALSAQLLAGANAYVRRGLQGPFQALQALISTLDTTVNNFSELVDIPVDIIRSVSRTAGQVRTTALKLIDAVFLDELIPEVDLLLQIIGLAQDIESAAESTATVTPQPNIEEVDEALSPSLPSSTAPIIEQAPVESVSAYRLRLGEDLRILARRFFGDPDQWPTLATLNSWLSADQDSRGEPPRAGDVILIPDPQSPPQTSSDLYGQDLLIVNGDLELKANDFSLVSSTKNLEQAAAHRLQSQAGESIIERYGLPERIGQRLTAASSGYLSAHISEQLLLDPRIEQINVIELRDQGDHLSASLEFTARSGALISSAIRI